jgi:hypothetical protein
MNGVDRTVKVLSLAPKSELLVVVAVPVMTRRQIMLSTMVNREAQAVVPLLIPLREVRELRVPLRRSLHLDTVLEIVVDRDLDWEITQLVVVEVPVVLDSPLQITQLQLQVVQVSSIQSVEPIYVMPQVVEVELGSVHLARPAQPVRVVLGQPRQLQLVLKGD